MAIKYNLKFKVASFLKKVKSSQLIEAIASEFLNYSGISSADYLEILLFCSENFPQLISRNCDVIFDNLRTISSSQSLNLSKVKGFSFSLTGKLDSLTIFEYTVWKAIYPCAAETELSFDLLWSCLLFTINCLDKEISVKDFLISYPRINQSNILNDSEKLSSKYLWTQYFKTVMISINKTLEISPQKDTNYDNVDDYVNYILKTISSNSELTSSIAFFGLLGALAYNIYAYCFNKDTFLYDLKPVIIFLKFGPLYVKLVFWETF